MTEENRSEHDNISPYLSTYFKNVLHSIAGQREFVDITCLCDDLISFTLSGIYNVNSNVVRQSPHLAARIMGYALKGIYDTYEEEYDFYEPFLTYCPTSSQLTITVGLYKKPFSPVITLRVLVLP